MKTLKKSLCVLLSILMIFSSVSVLAFAEGEEAAAPEYTYSLKYYANKTDKEGMAALLDEADKLLAKQNIYFELYAELDLVVDLRSVSALCGTLDLLKRFLVADSILDAGTTAIIKGLLGQLGDDINLKNWTTGMSRPKDDIAIVKNLIGFLKDNSAVIGGIVKGGYDMGIVNNFVNLDEMLGADGVSGMLKEMIFGLVYSGEAEKQTAYNTYKNNVDGFVYGPLLEKYAGQYLKGFTMTADTTVEALICAAFNAALTQYVVPWVKGVDIKLAGSGIADLEALAPYVNLKGATLDLSDISLDANKDLLGQVNNLVGKIFTQIVPGYAWIDGDYTKISENIEGAFKYLGKVSGLIENADEKSFDEIVKEVIAIVLRNVDLGVYDDGVTECKTLEDMAKAALVNAAREMNITYSYSEDESYLVVLGDILAVWAYDNFNIKDNNGGRYRGQQGDNVWTVANYLANYFLFDEGIAKVLGLSVTKTDTIFTKIDKLADYFGSTKSKGVSFDSKKFILGDGETKGILDSIFSLDIENLIEITAKPALDTAGDVKAVEFVYNTLRYFLNNWAGAQLFPAYVKGTAFTTALSNNNIATLLANLLNALNSRKDALAVLIAFVGAVLIKGEAIDLGTPEITVEDAVYTGDLTSAKATVKLGGKTLIQDVDYIAVVDASQIGDATALIKLIGIYKGETEMPCKVVLGEVEKITYTTSTTKARLRWTAVPGADEYNVYYGTKLLGTIADGAELTRLISGLKAATKYTFKVEAVDNESGEKSVKSVTLITNPAKVTGLKVAAVSDSAAKLTWTKVAGATGYVVERYSASKKAYVREAVVKDPTFTMKGLYSYTSYKFRVKAYVQGDSTVYGEYSSVVTAKTKLGKVTNLKVSSKSSTAMKLTWSAVKNAKSYEIWVSTNGGKSYKQINTTTATNYTVKGLKAATPYYFKVRAIVSSKVKGDASAALKEYAKLPKVTGLKASGATASSVKLSWKKLSGATEYVVYKSKDGKTWTKVGSTPNTSCTVKSLSSGTTWKFKVVGYSSKIKTYADDSAVVSLKTLVGKVSGVKATARKRTSVSLSWTKAAGATGYQVYYSKDGKTWTKAATVKTNSCTVSGLTRNTNYQFKVRAYQTVSKKTVYGAYSSVIKAKTTLI